jgi:hypothetical protein
MRPRFTCLLALILFIVSSPAISGQETTATAPVEGVWRWTFTMPDGSQVTPRLELKQEAGQWSGTTRIRIGSDTPVTNLVVNGNEVSFQVVRQRDGQEVVTRYAGIWSSNTIRGKISSNWSGAEQSYDWEALRSTGPAGIWKWSSGPRSARFESRLTLKQEGDKGDKLSGKLSGGRGGDSDIHKGRFKAGEISFQIERERNGETFISRYSGKLLGEKILGQMEVNLVGEIRTNRWEATRVE